MHDMDSCRLDHYSSPTVTTNYTFTQVEAKLKEVPQEYIKSVFHLMP